MKAQILALFLVALATLSPKYCEGYRILGMFPFQSSSHFMMFEALMKGLSRKGHQVDVVSPFPLKKPYPNYTDIIQIPIITPELVNNVTYDYFKTAFTNVPEFIAKTIGNEICKNLGHPEMVKLLWNNHDPPYDVVLAQVYGAHCYLSLGNHFKVPVIGLSTALLHPWGNGIIGNPANLAFVPNSILSYSPPLTFWQRLYNTVHTVYIDMLFQHYSKPQDEIMKKYLGKEAPTVREAERSLALVMVNSHPALNGPKPVTPGLIEVGGLHIQDDGAKLSSDMEKWMNDSTDGFIYFTFGSMVLIESFPEETIKNFYRSLGKIAPVRVLIKIPNPKILPPGLPDNFRTFRWAPQLKVLQHKNVKAFITHGGLMSTQEAIHCAVPMIGIPLFNDQFININLYKTKKIAIGMDLKRITEESLDHALKEILYNPLYKNTMNKVSASFLDRPMSVMDTATWWVEYIVRQGSDALRSPAMDLTWWQIELLDVYAFILLVAALAMILTIAFVHFLINMFSIIMRFTEQKSKKIQ